MNSSVHPYPYYADLRSADPVHESQPGVWLLTRYDDVHSMLRDPRFGRKGFLELVSARGAEPEAGSPMQFQDPPGHTRLRNLVSSVFTHSLVEGLRPRVQEIVDHLLDDVRNAGAPDLISCLGIPLSLRVILELMGVPLADHERFRQWSRDMTEDLDAAPASSEIFTRRMATQQAIAEYFRDLVAERRKRPRADLVSGLIAAEQEGPRLGESELVDICGLLFVAGHVTTVNLIGNGVLNLLLHPSELRRLRQEPGLIAQAVEELLRYDSPVQRVGRMTNTEVEIRGKVIPEGAVVIAMLGAANRDPAQHTRPEHLDIARRHNRHLAFGQGAHACLGAPLARLEGQIAIGTIVRRLPKLALVSQTPEWRNSTETRGLKELRVTF